MILIYGGYGQRSKSLAKHHGFSELAEQGFRVRGGPCVFPHPLLAHHSRGQAPGWGGLVHVYPLLSSHSNILMNSRP